MLQPNTRDCAVSTTEVCVCSQHPAYQSGNTPDWPPQRLLLLRSGLLAALTQIFLDCAYEIADLACTSPLTVMASDYTLQRNILLLALTTAISALFLQLLM